MQQGNRGCDAVGQTTSTNMLVHFSPPFFPAMLPILYMFAIMLSTRFCPIFFT